MMGTRYRKGKNTDWARLDIMTGYSKKYGDAWDRVFGKKSKKQKEDKAVNSGKSL